MARGPGRARASTTVRLASAVLVARLGWKTRELAGNHTHGWQTTTYNKTKVQKQLNLLVLAATTAGGERPFSRPGRALFTGAADH